LTQFAAASDDLLRVIESEMGDEENNEEEERLEGLWQTRRVRRRGLPGHGGEVHVAGAGSESVDNPESEEMDNREQETPLTVDNCNAIGVKRPREGGWGGACKAWAADESKWSLRAQRTAWPHWVYRQFDAYELGRRAAGKCWKHQVLFYFFVSAKL